MADLLVRHPFEALEDEMERLMGRVFGRPAVFAAGQGFWHPPVDIHRTDDSITVRVDLPGIDPKKEEVKPKRIEIKMTM